MSAHDDTELLVRVWKLDVRKYSKKLLHQMDLQTPPV